MSRLTRRPIVDALVIGDSHIRVFEHVWFLAAMPTTRFVVEYVPGATAIGIVNRHSITSAWARFDTALDEIDRDLVIVNLGEVDTGYSLWRLVETRGDAMPEILERSVVNYCEYIGDLSRRGRVVILSAPLPTLDGAAVGSGATGAIRERVEANQKERTALTLTFNARIRDYCASIGVPYLDSSPAALGAQGVVKSAWCRTDLDHHYARWPYARDIVRQLGPLLRVPPARVRAGSSVVRHGSGQERDR